MDDGVILEFNVNASERLGYDRDKIIKTFSIYDLLSPKEQMKLNNILESHKKGFSHENFELCIKTADGETEHVLFNINIVDKKSSTSVYELMGICITDRVKI